MVWLDDVVLQLMPVFIVMTLLAVLIPSVRRSVAWRGIGAAWLAVVVVVAVIAITNPDSWDLSCDRLGMVRTTVTHATQLGADGPCAATNNLPLWLLALPPLAGMGVLLAWVARRMRPLQTAVRAMAALSFMAAVTIGVGQVSEGLALGFLAAIVVVVYVWPRLETTRPAASA
jgi:hypothetical protein